MRLFNVDVKLDLAPGRDAAGQARSPEDLAGAIGVMLSDIRSACARAVHEAAPGAIEGLPREALEAEAEGGLLGVQEFREAKGAYVIESELGRFYIKNYNAYDIIGRKIGSTRSLLEEKAPGEPPAMPGLMLDLCEKAAAVGCADVCRFTPLGRDPGSMLNRGSVQEWAPREGQGAMDAMAAEGGRVVEEYMENGGGVAINPDGSITLDKEWIGDDDGVRSSLDEVLVKAQKPKRRRKRKKGEAGDGEAAQDGGKRSYVKICAVHVEGGEGDGKWSHVLRSPSIDGALRLLLAFLTANGLVGQKMTFLIDGERSLRGKIESKFKNSKVILDWFHLDKKIKELFSMAMPRGPDRDEIRRKVMGHLWSGDCAAAIRVLAEVPESLIKSGRRGNMDDLIKRVEGRRDIIPNYKQRKERSKRISSNLVESLNRSMISNRKKKKGISWSKTGSIALAALKTLMINGRLSEWVCEGNAGFEANGLKIARAG
jgi:hypothetical protein